MNVAKRISSIITASLIVVALSACTPPKPPELLAQEAEQTFTCIDGNAKVDFSPSIYGAVTTWQDSLTAACTGMTMTELAEGETADISVGAAIPDAAKCVPLISAPMAVDAGVIVAYLADGTQVALSAKSIGLILSGKITDWSDVQIKKDNPLVSINPLPIVVNTQADPTALLALTTWLTRLDSAFANTLIKPTPGFVVDTTALVDGSLTVMNFSDAAIAGLTPASIVVGKNPKTDYVGATVDTIDSGASQFVASHTTTGVSVKLNPDKKPTPPRGADIPFPPYQAVYPINVTLCGAESLTNRAIAKFLLRLDSQGAISNTSLVGIPEEIRIESILEVSKGLPKASAPTN